VPIVESGELINQVNKGGDLILRVVSHNLIGSPLGRDTGVGQHLAVDKALKVGSQRAIGNSLVVRVVSTIHLKIDTSHRVVRVMEDGVVVLVLTVPLLAVGLIDILGVPERAIVDDIIKTMLLHAT
jgi:hypothetical protein